MVSRNFKVNPKVIREDFDGEIVMINLDSGNYYSFNKSAGEIWSSVEDGRTEDEILSALMSRYEGDGAQMRGALSAMLHKMMEENLVAPAEYGNGNGASPERNTSAAPKTPFVMPEISVFTDMQDLLLLDPIHDVDQAGWPARPGDVAAGER